jgi:NADH:ubiquinone oxidoreductase subunit K
MIELQTLIAVSAALFCLGVLGLFVHRHVIALWVGVELMLSAGNLALVAFDRHWAAQASSGHGFDGNVLAFVILAVCVAQTVVGAALLLSCCRNWDSLNIEGIDRLKW